METISSFTARVITGAGRGKQMGVPTLNLALTDVPADFDQGIYACYAIIQGQKLRGAMHYGPRPVFQDDTACEIHLLDLSLARTPETVTVHVVEHLRDVADFPSPEALKRQIDEDIRRCKDILGAG
jgi:riboflavin kinase/FMN adenylyltransferase